MKQLAGVWILVPWGNGDPCLTLFTCLIFPHEGSQIKRIHGRHAGDVVLEGVGGRRVDEDTGSRRHRLRETALASIAFRRKPEYLRPRRLFRAITAPRTDAPGLAR